MLTGFFLEILRGPSWRRDALIHWSVADAERTAKLLLQRRTIHLVRIVPVTVIETEARLLSKDGVESRQIA